LLILVSACYVLPVKEAVFSFDQVCMVDLEEAKEESAKKEKNKELFSFSSCYLSMQDGYTHTHSLTSGIPPSRLHQVETPPPDRV